MGKQVAARLKKNITAVKLMFHIELVLPVIRGFRKLSFLMTDKNSVRSSAKQRGCTLKTSYRD